MLLLFVGSSTLQDMAAVLKYRKSFDPEFMKLDTAANKWCRLSPMSFMSLRFYSLLHVGDNIYVIGGYDCQKYSIDDNQWCPIARLDQLEPKLEPTCIGFLSATVHNDKILIYGSSVYDRDFRYDPRVITWVDISVHAPGVVKDHYLFMYNSGLNTWVRLLTCSHPEGKYDEISTGLVVHNEKCYRIVDGNCQCREVGCQWHALNICELVIDINGESAVVGELQDQALIPAEFKGKAFRIEQDVFVICGGKVHNTEIKITRNQVDEVNLDDWKEFFQD